LVSDDETAALVERAQRGDAASCDELVRRFLRVAYSVALAVLLRRADAEDVAQDAMVAALEQLGSCRNPRAFKGWLVQIVKNRALNALEKRRVRADHARREQSEDALDVAGAAAVGQREKLLAALARIPASQREVVLLHDLEDWTHAEIAEATGISEVTSRQRLFQARRALRDALSGEEPGRDDEGS
jgi:RNA polymerase sigma-70 factor, ECF subfamily